MNFKYTPTPNLDRSEACPLMGNRGSWVRMWPPFSAKYLYRDKKGKLMPYADKNNGLFEVKECFNEKTAWSGTQTLVTPKGRETFRLLYTHD